jgi:hypothetical protein
MNIKDKYNLGEELRPEIKISGSGFSGFLMGDILCNTYTNNIYKSYMTLDKESNMTLENFPVFGQMEGECVLKILLENLDKSVYEEKRSDKFEVSSELIAEIDNFDLDVMPSGQLVMTGFLYNIRKEEIPGMVKVSLDNTFHNFVIQDSSFYVSIPIPADISSGKNNLVLTFEDNKGNSIDELFKLNVIPNPTSISIKINDDIYLPYEKMIADITVIDQAGMAINKQVLVKLMEDKKVIYSKEQESGIFTYMFDNTFEPGTYKLSASIGDIRKDLLFDIGALEKIESELVNQTVFITNVGNVRYSNITSIYLSNGEEIVRKISIGPGEKESIDLSKELPEGKYSIVLPTGESIEEVHVDDNRGFFKRFGAGFTSITGNAIRTVTENNVTLGIVVLFLVILVGIAILQYVGYPVSKVVKKPVSMVSNIFKKK